MYRTQGREISRLFLARSSRSLAARETARSLPESAVKESLAGLGAEQNLEEPRVFDGEIRNEIAANAALVTAGGVPISGQSVAPSGATACPCRSLPFGNVQEDSMRKMTL